MISIPESGCKTLWISALLAILLIVLTIALSRHAKPYAVSVADVRSAPRGAWRIDATVGALDMQSRHAEILLCRDGACIRALAPLSMSARVEPGRQIIVQGEFVDGIFQIKTLLTRCH